ncbi:hypothetical protein FHS40_001040 [Streptomyces spectabilis]|uniref:Uncharacterized protein n=1 Tax=Streptomyces spectabilis TaxID=68270 RepID=A0A7W8AP84_STRST|nr:hypothetical protein [Streptomyces spectabilis]
MTDDFSPPPRPAAAPAVAHAARVRDTAFGRRAADVRGTP